MVYNLNLGIGWASSGVEYAQSYRANMFRRLGIEAKFVFMDMFPNDNIEHMTKNISFLDDEIIWLYTYFTNTKIAPVSFSLDDLKKTFTREYSFSREGKICRFDFGNMDFYTAYMVDETSDLVHRVELVSGGKLVRKDYYTYCRIYSEYYAPYDNKAHLYQRRFFHEDGSVAYEEIVDEDHVLYRFKDRVLYSKEELIGYMIQSFHLTSEDVVIIDRSTGIAQAVFENKNDARIGMIIHADHFSEGRSDEYNILWNNFYEYAFAQSKYVDFYVAATEAQRLLLLEQFEKYHHKSANVVTIPVGSIDTIKLSEPGKRKKHSLITASRLANEKHCDWLILAVAEAKKQIPDLSLDIYGKGGQENQLLDLIKEYDCGDYIRLMGQQNLDQVYINYEAYISASQSEGFGLTLMEAIGSGLPIIGFDVRYGNQTFIDSGKNGYLIPFTREMDKKTKINQLTEYIIKLFSEESLEKFEQHSYQKANEYLTSEVEKRWQTLINQTK